MDREVRLYLKFTLLGLSTSFSDPIRKLDVLHGAITTGRCVSRGVLAQSSWFTSRACIFRI
jgi:hypothetical protein